MEPHLTRVDVDGPPSGVVLMLHGGRPSSSEAVDSRSASWLRMAALQRALAGRARDHGLAVWLLRYRHVGWNGGHGPTSDARDALDLVRRECGDVPVVLLGHSMGGRVAVHVAGDGAVAGVVALAPWWEPGDPVTGVRGKRVVAAHGRRDRITSYRRTEAWLARAARAGADVEMVDMGPRGHYLLTGASEWNRVAMDGVLSALPAPRR